MPKSLVCHVGLLVEEEIWKWSNIVMFMTSNFGLMLEIEHITQSVDKMSYVHDF